MFYRVLSRKHRPKKFSDLIGQDFLVRILRNSFVTNRIPHSWIFTGMRGVGKTTTARLLARALNYKNHCINSPNIDFIEFGDYCKDIMEGDHIDVLELDAASHTGIDDIRIIIEQVQYRPILCRYKIYIIDEVHMLSKQAFNGLLKTLEDPPDYVKFIFCTTEIQKIPKTIISRCQRFNLRRINVPTMVQYLKNISEIEKININDFALSIIAHSGEGSVRDSLSILDQVAIYGNNLITEKDIRVILGLSDRTKIINLFEFLMNGKIVEALNEFREIYDAGSDPESIIIDVANLNYLISKIKLISLSKEDIIYLEEEEKMEELSKKISLRSLLRSWQIIFNGILDIQKTQFPLQAAEMLLIRIAHTSDLPLVDEIIESFSKNEKSLDYEKSKINSLDELIFLSKKHNDLEINFFLKECLSLISLNKGKIEFLEIKEVPKMLSHRIESAIYKWTKEKWEINIIKKEENVLKVLNKFPGSKIINN